MFNRDIDFIREGEKGEQDHGPGMGQGGGSTANNVSPRPGPP
jgi:hypothetical protein